MRSSGPRSITELSHAVGEVLRTAPTEKLRFDSMDLCEELLERTDLTRDSLMQETLRSWIGKVQTHVGNQ